MNYNLALDKDELDVFKTYCRVDQNIMNDCSLVTSTYIAKEFNWTLHKARKIIKNLVDRGLIASGYYSYYDNDTERSFILRGYKITDFGRSVFIYKNLQWQEAKICHTIFGGGTPYEYYKTFNK